MRPLSGVRVVDFTTAWAGPRLGTYLAELGAEVIHLESIQYLDVHRGWGKWERTVAGNYPNDELGERPWDRVSYYVGLNKGKRGVTLNLGDPRGVELFSQLLAASDVLIENYRAGQLARFGFDEAALRRIRPDLIVVTLPAFGSGGPYSNYTAWGDQASAIAGLGRLFSYPDEEEPEIGGTYGDPIAAAAGTLATLAALRHRRRFGVGQTIEVPLAEGILPLLPEPIVDYTFNGRLPKAVGSGHAVFAPWGLFRCAGDDAWVAICVEDDGAFAGLAQAMDRPELIDDPRFSTVTGRQRHRAEIDSVVSDWTSGIPAREIADRLQSAGIAAEAVQDINEVTTDRQLLAREFFITLDHPDAGPHRYAGPAAHYSAGSAAVVRGAPTLGQDNRYVLGEILGLSEEEIAVLVTGLVVGDEPLEDSERRG